MPRSRSSEMPQRQSPRGVHPLRTSSSDSDPLHHRPITDRSPKLGDRRSPRGSQPDQVHQKKLGTRIADLESQLGQAQEELKNLKDQLASAEAAKKKAQLELENKTNKPGGHPETDKQPQAEINDPQEVNADASDPIKAEHEPEPVVLDDPIIITEPQTTLEPGSRSLEDETKLLKAKLEEKEKELDAVGKEEEELRKQLSQATSDATLAKEKEEEMSMRLRQQGKELEESRENAANLKERLEAAERAREAAEAEIKKMRVQTEQWRKAADAAAAVLAGTVEMNGRIGERCGSLDKNFGGVFEASGFGGSPAGMGDDLDDGFASGKRRGSGIKMFGDLWRKRGHK